jgi:BirA family biotin operon repressor/biotin-[acetyl-CoA-carboxylase] ligase
MPEAHRVNWEVHMFPRLGSTNTSLRELAATGAPEGTVVVADEQTEGRGRFDRSWNSPAGAGFYGSFLFRPSLGARDVQALTFVAAIAVAETLAGLGVAEVALKWSNDVLARGRKVCGILLESSFLGEGVEWAVVGIGVNLKREAVPPDPMVAATSLADEGVEATNVYLLGLLLEALERWYAALVERGPSAVLDRWAELAPMARGAAVTVDDGREIYEATTEGLTPEGHLLVRRLDGRVTELSAADVRLGRPR